MGVVGVVARGVMGAASNGLLIPGLFDLELVLDGLAEVGAGGRDE